jgi:hypothetical protein
MRALAVIAAVLLAGCAFWRKPEGQVAEKPATAQAQKVATDALDRALQPQPTGPATQAVATALSAMASVSKVAIRESNAKSEQLTNAQTINTVTRVAAIGLALSFLAFFFGSYVGINRLAAVASSALCLSVAVAAPAILQALGTDAAQLVIISCFAILGLSATLSLGWLVVDKAMDYARKSK